MLSTPTRITADVRRLSKRITPGVVPVYVDVMPRSDSRLNDCFCDVERQVAECGGEIQHGWTVWEWPGIFIEGEFHAVWRSPEGRLLDVSRKKDGEKRILFIPDLSQRFSGQRVDNIRLQIGRDPRINELLRTQQAFHRIMNRKMKDVPFGSPVVIEGEALSLKQKAAELEFILLNSRHHRRALK